MVRHVVQGGRFSRVADPAWADPLDPSYAQRSGGRWNPPRSFGIVYLCADVATARANLVRLYVGLPYGPEDLDPERAPQLVGVDLPMDRYVDAVSDAGLRALELPASCPRDTDGETVPHQVCQPIGRRLYDAAELGIACRSAAPGAAPGRELAWFSQPDRPPLTAQSRQGFESWFWG